MPQGCEPGHFPFWPLCPLPNCPVSCKFVNEAGEGLQGGGDGDVARGWTCGTRGFAGREDDESG